MTECKLLTVNHTLYFYVYPYPIDFSAVGEAQLLKNLDKVPVNSESAVILAEGFNVRKIDSNKWLVIVSQPIHITFGCSDTNTQTVTIKNNFIFTIQLECSAYIGITKVQSEARKKVTITDNSHHVIIPSNCCRAIPGKIHIPKIKPFKLNNLNVEELYVANHKLNKYSRDLDNVINQRFVHKNTSWFTYATVAAVTVIVAS